MERCFYCNSIVERRQSLLYFCGVIEIVRIAL